MVRDQLSRVSNILRSADCHGEYYVPVDFCSGTFGLAVGKRADYVGAIQHPLGHASGHKYWVFSNSGHILSCSGFQRSFPTCNEKNNMQ